MTLQRDHRQLQLFQCMHTAGCGKLTYIPYKWAVNFGFNQNGALSDLCYDHAMAMMRTKFAGDAYMRRELEHAEQTVRAETERMLKHPDGDSPYIKRAPGKI